MILDKYVQKMYFLVMDEEYQMHDQDLYLYYKKHFFF
jgi:hypothetical protein